ncbi:hypothetical protein ACFYKX_10055 [Cytobacillus sp. FJAT-54145]|uniref:DUF2726 domain-containing protein n=1 Tax=Cytobacillus spartinae TaxID=3299023 RepID=A0ABW6KB51_9BACI
MARKSMTHEEFLKRVYESVGTEYQVTSLYQGSKEKVSMIHQTCGNSWSVLPNNFLRSKNPRRCPYCQLTQKTKTHEEFLLEAQVKGNGKYLVLGKYINNNTPIRMKHLACQHEFSVLPRNFLQGTGCSECAKKNRESASRKKKTHQEFLREVENKFGKNEYTFLGHYLDAHTPIKTRHRCGYKWDLRPNHLLRAKKPTCPMCSKTHQPTQAEWEKEVQSSHNGEYRAISVYQSHDRKVKLFHTVCGETINITPHSFRQGKGCRKCNLHILTTEEWKDLVNETTSGEYQAVGLYTFNDQKTSIKHMTCGTVYDVTPNSFKNGSRCPKCQESKGEKALRDFLTQSNTPFTPQYAFSDLYDKSPSHPLKFDVAIHDQPSFPLILVEYDGEQHFKPVNYMGGEDNFRDIRRRDKKKNHYSIQHQIPLIRIPYTVKPEDAPQVLEQELQNLQSSHPQPSIYLVNPLETWF